MRITVILRTIALTATMAHAGVILGYGQLLFDEGSFLAQISTGGALPENLLSSKTIVLFHHSYSPKELGVVQEYFQNSGIDAVAYYPTDMVVAGKDVSTVFAKDFTKREVDNLALLEKIDNTFRITILKFNGKPDLVETTEAGWSVSNKNLTEAMKVIQRTTSSGLKRENLLINTTPEYGVAVNPILGKRNEFYAVDMKVDLVAIPKFGDEEKDRELEQIISSNFPFKYKMTEPGVPEKELRKQGMLYTLSIIHTRAKVAQELLGYNTSKSETAVVSVTYPEGSQQLINIPANAPVYKVYFKHIDSGNVFLGTKWDADLTWQSALLNQIRGMKAELRLN